MDAVFPCILRIMPTCVFNKKDPIVLGVEIAEGIAKAGTLIHFSTSPMLRPELARDPEETSMVYILPGVTYALLVVEIVCSPLDTRLPICHMERVHALQVGTPLCIPSQKGLDLGRIASIELNHKPVRALPCLFIITFIFQDGCWGGWCCDRLA